MCITFFRERGDNMSYTNWDNLKPKTCLRCGKSFVPNNPRRMYCSNECRRGHGTCKVCGKDFVKSSNVNGEYCSTECWYKSGDAKRYPGRECPACHKIFNAKSKLQKYCSVECGNMGRRKGREPKRCKLCGKLIPKGKYKARYCSSECRNQAYSIAWKTTARPEGYKRLSQYGYVLIKVGRVWLPEHREVMAQKLGRALEKYERVHHVNGDRADNRPENLELWRDTHPYGIRSLDAVKDTISKLGAEQRAQLLEWLQEQV